MVALILFTQPKITDKTLDIARIENSKKCIEAHKKTHEKLEEIKNLDSWAKESKELLETSHKRNITPKPQIVRNCFNTADDSLYDCDVYIDCKYKNGRMSYDQFEYLASILRFLV